jgi:hypothetical protein
MLRYPSHKFVGMADIGKAVSQTVWLYHALSGYPQSSIPRTTCTTAFIWLYRHYHKAQMMHRQEYVLDLTSEYTAEGTCPQRKIGHVGIVYFTATCPSQTLHRRSCGHVLSLRHSDSEATRVHSFEGLRLSEVLLYSLMGPWVAIVHGSVGSIFIEFRQNLCERPML